MDSEQRNEYLGTSLNWQNVEIPINIKRENLYLALLNFDTQKDLDTYYYFYVLFNKNIHNISCLWKDNADNYRGLLVKIPTNITTFKIVLYSGKINIEHKSLSTKQKKYEIQKNKSISEMLSVKFYFLLSTQFKRKAEQGKKEKILSGKIDQILDINKLDLDYCTKIINTNFDDNQRTIGAWCPHSDNDTCLNWRRVDFIGQTCKNYIKSLPNTDIDNLIMGFCNLYKNATDCKCINRISNPEYKANGVDDYCSFSYCSSEKYLRLKNHIPNCLTKTANVNFSSSNTTGSTTISNNKVVLEESINEDYKDSITVSTPRTSYIKESDNSSVGTFKNYIKNIDYLYLYFFIVSLIIIILIKFIH